MKRTIWQWIRENYGWKAKREMIWLLIAIIAVIAGIIWDNREALWL